MILHLLRQLAERQIVLASGSPRRKEILEKVGLHPIIIPSSFDEKSLDKASFESPLAFVKENALQKALEVADRDGIEFDVVIGADSVVVHDGVILEKPESDAEAAAMMATLSGGQHSVATGVALVVRRGDVVSYKTFVEETVVQFADLSQEEIAAYIQHGDHSDKAGGYGIQSLGALFVQGIQGDYYNVMGFPLHSFANQINALSSDGLI